MSSFGVLRLRHRAFLPQEKEEGKDWYGCFGAFSLTQISDVEFEAKFDFASADSHKHLTKVLGLFCDHLLNEKRKGSLLIEEKPYGIRIKSIFKIGNHKIEVYGYGGNVRQAAEDLIRFLKLIKTNRESFP